MMTNFASSVHTRRTGIRTGFGHRAFTLIELLVVITIIGLLVSLLLPSLKMARDMAVVGQCSSNMRQIGVAESAYAGDNRQYYADPIETTWPGFSWQEKLTSYVIGSGNDYRHEPVELGNWHDGTGTNGVTASMWTAVMTIHGYQTIAHTGIFNDPIYKPNTTHSWNSNVSARYAFNQEVLYDSGQHPGQPYTVFNTRGNTPGLPGDAPAYKMDEISHPLILVGPAVTCIKDDGNMMDPNGAFPWNLEIMRHMCGYDASKLTQSYYGTSFLPSNNGGENYLWNDGHVKWEAATQLWLRLQGGSFEQERNFTPWLQ